MCFLLCKPSKSRWFFFRDNNEPSENAQSAFSKGLWVYTELTTCRLTPYRPTILKTHEMRFHLASVHDPHNRLVDYVGVANLVRDFTLLSINSV